MGHLYPRLDGAIDIPTPWPELSQIVEGMDFNERML